METSHGLFPCSLHSKVQHEDGPEGSRDHPKWDIYPRRNLLLKQWADHGCHLRIMVPEQKQTKQKTFWSGGPCGAANSATHNQSRDPWKLFTQKLLVHFLQNHVEKTHAPSPSAFLFSAFPGQIFLLKQRQKSHSPLVSKFLLILVSQDTDLSNWILSSIHVLLTEVSHSTPTSRDSPIDP